MYQNQHDWQFIIGRTTQKLQLEFTNYSTSIALFYKARILSVLLYACPAWYPYLSRNEIDNKLERVCAQELFYLYIDDYDESLSQLGIEDLSAHLSVLRLQYVSISSIL